MNKTKLDYTFDWPTSSYVQMSVAVLVMRHKARCFFGFGDCQSGPNGIRTPRGAGSPPTFPAVHAVVHLNVVKYVRTSPFKSSICYVKDMCGSFVNFRGLSGHYSSEGGRILREPIKSSSLDVQLKPRVAFYHL